MDELTTESIIAEGVDQLTDEKREFLETHIDELDEETATKFGITKPPQKIEPEVRGGEGGEVKKKEEGKGDEEEEEILPEDKKVITKVVSEQLSPVQEQLRESQNIIEVDTFIRENADKIPNVGKYRSAMLTYMNHPAYAKIPAKNVFRVVAGDDLIKLGAQREREAAAKASGTQVQSSTARPTNSGEKNWATATKEEFLAKKAEVLGHP
jgi:hypothetical protein